MKTLRILSLGAGVQSSTLALMIEKGEVPMVDGAIFSDPWSPQTQVTVPEYGIFMFQYTACNTTSSVQVGFSCELILPNVIVWPSFLERIPIKFMFGPCITKIFICIMFALNIYL